MNLINKSFKDNKTGEIVKIIDSYQNIAITESKERIDATKLMDGRFYTEYVDPKSFFNDSSTYNVFAEKLLNLDTSKMPEDDQSFQVESVSPSISPSSESAVIIGDVVDEVEELKRKYGASLDNSALNKQNEAFAKILGEETQATVNQPQIKTNGTYHQPNEEVQRVEVDDPITTMFKSVKKNVDFSFNYKIEGKLPRYDFIEMMEDSYDISIIEFLAEDMTKKLLSDPLTLKNIIVEEIKKKVYNGKKETKAKTQVDETKEEVVSTETNKPVAKPKTSRKKRTTSQ